MKPQSLPKIPRFSSGPCAKRPGWTSAALDNALLGRSHRSQEGRARLQACIDTTRELLAIPGEYRIAIVAGSDTGAVEMALWSLLGAKPVTVLAWEAFGKGWITDIQSQLKLDAEIREADYGELPQLSGLDFSRDHVFTYNGTTAGVRLKNCDWIPDNRQALTICDATSAVFSMDLPWPKLDATTFSWQKVLGGEAQHGILILSPRAVERLESYTPSWPMPKIFRMTKKGKLNEAIFRGDTINTPSMLCVEDAMDSMKWGLELGGLQALITKSEANLQAVADWVKSCEWVDFLATDPQTRSCTSICLKIVDPWFTEKNDSDQRGVTKNLTKLLEQEGAAFDIGAYRDAPPGLRLWGGATIEQDDLKALFPWLEWAYSKVKNS